MVAQEVTCKQARQHNGEGGSAEREDVAQKRRRWKKREGRGTKVEEAAQKWRTLHTWGTKVEEVVEEVWEGK